MKHNSIPALVLTIAAITGFSGCDSAVGPTAEGAAMNTGRTVTAPAPADPGGLETVTVTGPLAVIDGAFAVLYQGNPYYIKDSVIADLAEGTIVTVVGERTLILDRDAGGNSLFWGYYLESVL